jgi:hypothetical protein
MSGVGHKYYGKMAVTISGQKAWDRQDAAKTWTDAGAVTRVLQATTAELERIVAENATLSVSEYLSTAQAGIRTTPEGEVMLGLRIENQEAAMIVEVPLRRLILAALSEMRPVLGFDPNAQQAVSAIVQFGSQLASIGRVPKVPSQQGGS